MNIVKIDKYKCKCSNNTFYLKDSGVQHGLYCAKCNKWVKWLPTSECDEYFNKIVDEECISEDEYYSMRAKMYADEIDINKKAKKEILDKLTKIFSQKKAFYTQEEVLNVLDFVREKI